MGGSRHRRGDSLTPSPAGNSVGSSRGKVSMSSGVTELSREARVFPELIFTRPHWDSQQEDGVEKDRKQRGAAERSTNPSGANEDLEARAGASCHPSLIQT